MIDEAASTLVLAACRRISFVEGKEHRVSVSRKEEKTTMYVPTPAAAALAFLSAIGVADAFMAPSPLVSRPSISRAGLRSSVSPAVVPGGMLARRSMLSTPRRTTTTNLAGVLEMMADKGKKKILVLGGDGFCGWPTSLHLSEKVPQPRL